MSMTSDSTVVTPRTEAIVTVPAAPAPTNDWRGHLPVLRAVGLPIAVKNAGPEVKAAARYVTSLVGGHGAVREVAERLLKARGEWPGMLAQYFETHRVPGRNRGSG